MCKRKTMNSENVKTRPLSRDETKVLLSLIEASKVINNKTTNATSNKMKSDEWVHITESFNATALCRRTVQQLRLKWENLKKNSRKRSTAIRMNSLKTGGDPPDCIPPDDILDRVSTLLGSTVDGFSVELGGDAEPSGITIFHGDGGESGDGSIGGDLDNIKLLGQEVIVEASTSSVYTPATPRPANKNFMNTPRAIGYKRKLVKADDGRTVRNLALAEYYNTKKKILDAKLENILLENEKLKMEVDKLKKNIN